MNFELWWGSVVGSAFTGLVVVDFVIRIAALGIVPHNRRPAAALAWLVVIFFMPIIGVVVFLLLGNSRLSPRRRDTEHRIADHMPKGIPTDSDLAPKLAVTQGIPQWALTAVRLNQYNGGTTLTAGNQVEVHADYVKSINTMTAAVEQAESFVHVQFYILVADYTTDRFFNALEHAHARGVDVRVLLDHVGSAGFPGYKAAIKRFEKAGIVWRRMLPVAPLRFHYQRPDLRNHRKIVVIDNRVGFAGSQNMIDASYNKKSNRRKDFQWLDLMVRLQGPIVCQLNAVFIADWAAETQETIPNDIPPPTIQAGNEARAGEDQGGGVVCQLLPSGPALGNENNLRLFNHLIYSARKQVIICSPYFVPDESLLMAVTSAVQRGVKVNLYMGATSDHFLTHHAQRSYYEMILTAGAQIHLYQKPYILHSKFILIDDQVAVVASSNMDIRSFVLNQEISLLLLDGHIVQELKKVEAQYRRASHKLDLGTWQERPLYQKFFDNVCRLTSVLQ